MANQIIPFDHAGAGIPTHIADTWGAEGNIASRATIDQLSYRGKVWRRVVEGEETTLTRETDEGTVPVQVVSVVILDHNKGRSRAFYAKAYVEGENQSPDCYSGDGVTPDAEVKEPCAATCATCPNSVKGSKITEAGKQVTACSPFKRIAVVPTGMLSTHPVLLLRLAQTSMWDKDNKDNEAKGWYAWDQYLDMLRARGAKHTAAVDTKMKFDTRMAYPKLLFSAARWLNPDETAGARSRIAADAEAITAILTGGSVDGVMGAPAVAASVPASKPISHRAQEEDIAAKAVKDAADKKAAKIKTARETAAAAAAAAAAALAAASAEEDDEDGGFSAAPAPTPVPVKTPTKATAKATAAPTTPTAVVEGTPSGLADLLDGWDK